MMRVVKLNSASKATAVAAVAAALLLSCGDVGPQYMFIPEPGADGRVRIFDFRSWFDISPDGKELAYVSETGAELYVYNFDTGRERMITPRAGVPLWSPDGRWITYAMEGNGGLWVVRRDGAMNRLLHWSPYGCGPYDWSPDGTRILFGAYRAQAGIFDVYYYDLAEGKAVFVAETEYNKFPFARWLPSGDRLVIKRAIGAEEVVSIIDLEGDLIQDVYRFNTEVYSAYLRDISPSGDRLLFEITLRSEGGRPRIEGNWILDLKTGRWEQALYNPDPANIRDNVARWLPDGRVVFGSWHARTSTGFGVYTVEIL
jgi:dipeptidyl aminopeptidase/acylaminoacyl peptidase